jgi:chemotaxis protein methyltransferase CheR
VSIPAVTGLLPHQLAAPPAESTTDEVTDQLVSELHARTGLDVSRYRRATVERRINNRMLAVGVSCRAEYLQLLRQNDSEARNLLERITIKVSRFYRNAAVFDALACLLPSLRCGGGAAPLRVWSAGCGRGEEPWTLAMLLEAAGIPGHVLATDVDRSSLASARLGAYREDSLRELPRVLRDAYLLPNAGAEFRIDDKLRARVEFAVHDLTAETPPTAGSRFDLILCRNVLIYFGALTQQRVFQSLRRTLAPGGILCLGEAEWPMHEAASCFETESASLRIFRRAESDAS